MKNQKGNIFILTGYSPINCQLNKKLESAKELLTNSNMTIGEIAFACLKTTDGRLQAGMICSILVKNAS